MSEVLAVFDPAVRWIDIAEQINVISNEFCRISIVFELLERVFSAVGFTCRSSSETSWACVHLCETADIRIALCGERLPYVPGPSSTNRGGLLCRDCFMAAGMDLSRRFVEELITSLSAEYAYAEKGHGL